MNFSTQPLYNEPNFLAKNFLPNFHHDTASLTGPNQLETKSAETAFNAGPHEAWVPMLAFLDTMQEAVSGVDEYLCVKYWNKSMARLTGVAIEDAMHRPLFSLLPHDFEQNLAARLGRLFEQRLSEKNGNAEVMEGEFSQRHGNSEFFDFSYRMRVLPTNAPRELAIISLCPVREGRRRQRRQEQPEAFGLLGQLSAGIAQELAEPLSTICSRIDNIVALTGNQWSESLEEELHSIITEVYRISNLVNNILTLSSPDSNGVGQVQLKELIPETILLLEHTLNRQIACVTALPEDLPPVSGDPVLLQSVLQNILRYAVEAAGEDAVPRLQAGVHLLSPATRHKAGKPAPYVIIRIEDRGALLTPAELAQIFDPIPCSRRFGIALGLGLFISKKIVESHGGQVQVTSERGRGTIFTIALKV